MNCNSFSPMMLFPQLLLLAVVAGIYLVKYREHYKELSYSMFGVAFGFCLASAVSLLYFNWPFA